jgi:hypothetical protein
LEIIISLQTRSASFSSPAEQQTPIVREDVKTQDVAENLKRALQAEREKRREIEARSKILHFLQYHQTQQIQLGNNYLRK